LLDRREAVCRFLGVSVAVIALAGLVVIAQHARCLIDQRQPILVAVRAAGQPARQLPYDDLRECPGPLTFAAADQERHLHAACP
jgi:hypothetical protein